jgi:hypothetical protein
MQITPRFSDRARARWLPRSVLAVVAVLALVGAACGDDGSGGGGSAGGDDMTIDVVSPTDGADVGESFDVDVETSVDIGETDTGLHHVHLYYDGETAEGEYDIVYSTPFTVTRLDPGEHVIEAVIANADHSITDARAEITVNVGAGAGGSTDPDSSDDSPPSTPPDSDGEPGTDGY